MAVYPDRIVLKSSTDLDDAIIGAIESTGTDAIVPGELVISRQDGTANIYTLDANGDVVSASVPELSALLDVDLTTPIADNSILAYDATSGKWVNELAPPYDISGNNLEDLGDVDANVTFYNQGYLYWDSDTNLWKSRRLTLDALEGLTLPADYLSGMVFRWNNDESAETGSPIGFELRYLGWADIDGRPEDLSDFNNDIKLGDLEDVNLTARPPNPGDIIAWTGSYWGTVPAPPVDLTGSYFTQLADVTEVSMIDGAVAVYDADNQVYEVRKLDYSELINEPTRLSDLSNDLNVSDFPNDAGYISSVDGLTIDTLSDVVVTNPENGQTLIYRNDEWVNEFGPPANISFSSIGDLSDVTYTQPGVEPGVLVVDNMGVLKLDSPQIGNGLTCDFLYDQEYGVGMEMLRSSDGSGSAVYADRSRGVTLRSDVNIVRLTGRTNTTNNRPELRFETGDNGATTPTGQYIGIKMPAEVDENVTYILPGADGEVGDVLATDGSGNLEWSTPAQLTELGNLQDVDLATRPPIDGEALIYNAAAQVWMPGPVSDIDLGQSSINALRDVDTSTNPPGNGQALVWDITASNWVPGTVESTTTWRFTANGTTSYSFFGPGFPTLGSDGNPEIFVQRGQVYRIVNTSGGHPMQIQSTEGPGGTPYSTGITAGTNPIAASQEITWEIPMDAPDKLYYQCTSHSLMRGVITVGGGGGGGGEVTDERATDTQSSADGTVVFTGIGKSGTLVSVSSTQDAWVVFYTTEAARTADSARLYDVDPTPGSGVLCEVFCQAGGTVFTTPGTVYHNNDTEEANAIYAAVRDQSGVAVVADVTVKAYPNLAGISSGGGGTATDLDSLTDVNASSPSDGQGLVWSDDDSAWVQGPEVARWTQPGADPYASDVSLLMLFNGDLDDETGSYTPSMGAGTAAYATGRNSTQAISFDGTNNVTIGDGDNLDLPSDFCIEFWTKPSSLTGLRGMLTKRNPLDAGAGSWGIAQDGGTWGFRDLDSLPVTNYNSSTTLTAGVWQHIAVTREGTTLRLFHNGNLTDTFTNVNRNWTNTYDMKLGEWGGNIAQYFYLGDFEDLRVTQGHARYTASFTPPAQELSLTGTGAKQPLMPLDILTDVSTSSASDGDALVYSVASGQWVPGDVISLTTLKAEVAASTDFADFQSRIAAL